MNESVEDQLTGAKNEMEELKHENEILRARLSTRKCVCAFCKKIIDYREKICVYNNTREKLTKLENFHLQCYDMVKKK